ncbi:hypothetical protein VE04_10219, partial [Pseudogymnoascus sp. 24MN13]
MRGGDETSDKTEHTTYHLLQPTRLPLPNTSRKPTYLYHTTRFDIGASTDTLFTPPRKPPDRSDTHTGVHHTTQPPSLQGDRWQRTVHLTSTPVYNKQASTRPKKQTS